MGQRHWLNRGDRVSLEISGIEGQDAADAVSCGRSHQACIVNFYSFDFMLDSGCVRSMERAKTLLSIKIRSYRRSG